MRKSPFLSVFKTRKEERQWIHQNMLTVRKLIEWLQKQDPDALVYRFETNTGDWQEIPDDFDRFPGWFETVAQGKKRDRKSLRSMYKGNPNIDEKVKEELKDIYKYTEPNGVLIRL